MFDQAQEQLSTLRDLLRFAVSRFNEAQLFFGHGSDNALDEAVYLLLHRLHLPLDRLEPFLDATLTRDERASVLQIVERRVRERLPAAYLTNEAWLGEYRFYVDQRVIVPRSFIAELLHDQLAPWIDDPAQVAAVLDLCTGSGCIAIALAREFPEAEVDAIDISEDALDVTQINIDMYGLEQQVIPIASDLFAGLPAGDKYDLIVSNPPYVDEEDMFDLPDEFRHEPELALAAGHDGLVLAKRILATAGEFLSEHGVLVVEVGNSFVQLQEQYPDVPFQWVEFAHGGLGVFVMTKAQLDEYSEQFAEYRS